MAGYDSLLLDHDGVVVDVLDVSPVRQAALDAFAAVGVDAPDDDHVDLVAFGPTYDELVSVCEHHGVDHATLWRHRDDNLADALREAARDGGKQPYPDAAVLADLEVPTGIVSNNQRRVVEFIAEQYDLTDHFAAIQAREPHVDSLARKKPEPVFLESVIEDLGVSEPLYVGDRESDVVAGERAGVDTAFIRREHNADVTLTREPTYEVESLEAVADIVRGTAAADD